MKAATAREHRAGDFCSTRVAMFIAIGFTLGGCATIVNGPTQKVEFASNPPGAAVKVDGIPIGNTPVSLPLKRDSTHQVSFAKSGYADSEETVSQKWSWWIVGNVFSIGIGMIVDASTGDMYDLTPEVVSPTLIGQNPPAAVAAPAMSTGIAPAPSQDTPAAPPAGSGGAS